MMIHAGSFTLSFFLSFFHSLSLSLYISTYTIRTPAPTHPIQILSQTPFPHTFLFFIFCQTQFYSKHQSHILIIFILSFNKQQ